MAFPFLVALVPRLLPAVAAVAMTGATIVTWSARADAPGVEPAPVRHARRHVRQAWTPRAVAIPAGVLVPPCEDGVELLLRCAPRAELPVAPSDTGLLNEIATVPPARLRPYRQLFGWD